jgi:hypothetical protein
MKTIPHCDDLYLQYFDRWLDDDLRTRRGFTATRPDMLEETSLQGVTQVVAGLLDEDGRTQVTAQIEAMIEAARGDWPEYLGVRGKPDLRWIDAFDHYYDRNRIRKVLDRSDPADFGNDYVILCCEFGAVLGFVMQQLEPHLIWYLDWPYWESAILDPRSGNLIPTFHWAIKKMSEYGVDDGFAAKVRACLEIIEKPL